jgi:hypothetical protein
MLTDGAICKMQLSATRYQGAGSMMKPFRLFVREVYTGDTHRLTSRTRFQDPATGETGRLGELLPGRRVNVGEERILVEVLFCTAPRCSGHQYAKGLCMPHYQRQRRGSEADGPIRRGPARPRVQLRVDPKTKPAMDALPDLVRTGVNRLSWAVVAINDHVTDDGAHSAIVWPVMLSRRLDRAMPDQGEVRAGLLAASAWGWLTRGEAELICPEHGRVWSGPSAELENGRSEHRCSECGRTGSQLLTEETFHIRDEIARRAAEQRRSRGAH